MKKNIEFFLYKAFTALSLCLLLNHCKKDQQIPQPSISSFVPSSGFAGDQVQITGNNFSDNASNVTVQFNGTNAVVSSSSKTQLAVIVPSGTTTGTISVTVNGRTAISASPFTVLERPVIAGFSPTSGAAGSSVTLTGMNFDPTVLTNNAVEFNGIAATVTAVTATSITVTVPSGATTGTIAVTVNGQKTVSSSSFTVLVPPIISSFLPTSGGVGSIVTIAGMNFDPTVLTNNVVKFNGISAIVTAATATSITTSVPSGTTTGTITVTVNGLTGSSTSSFTVLVTPASDFIHNTSGLAVFNNTTGSSAYALGYKFTPKVNGTIIALGVASPKSGTYTVQLYDANTQALLGSSTVNYTFDATHPIQFAYVNLANPVNVTPSGSYCVVYTTNTYDTYYGVENYVSGNPVLPANSAKIAITAGVIGSPLSFPVGAGSNLILYTADVKIQ